MNAILIKPTDKKMFSKILEAIKSLKAPARILSNTSEDDLLWMDAMEESMKSGQADKNEMKKFFLKHGVEIL